ncbi:MAG: hypothetical protein ABIT38_13550 [Gemmatimonadaceae bacterium]
MTIPLSSGATRRLFAALLLATSASACGARPHTSDPGGVRSSDVLTIDEILTSKTQNAYDAVRRLRPSFLQTRGPTTLTARSEAPTAPLVYLDNRRYGDIESLRTLTVDGIFEIRYLSPNQAQLKWGMNHASGVIHVLTMSGRTTKG